MFNIVGFVLTNDLEEQSTYSVVPRVQFQQPNWNALSEPRYALSDEPQGLKEDKSPGQSVSFASGLDVIL